MAKKSTTQPGHSDTIRRREANCYERTADLKHGGPRYPLTRAGSAVGREEITVSSEKVAQDAADQFLGPGKVPINQQYGSRVGQQVGWKSADGSRVVIDDTSAERPHYNFHNKLTGGNLHVYIK